MTISQVIQTISLGNFTYFAVSHAYFSQISSTAATMPPCFGNNVMFCRGRIGMGRIGQELHWLGLHWHGSDWHGSDWHGSHRLGLHWHWIILYRKNVLGGTKCCFCGRLFHLKRFIGTKSRITPENLDEHHFFDVNGNIVFTSAEVRFSTRLICSFDERNSKRSRLAKSYFCVLLKSRNEFTS